MSNRINPAGRRTPQDAPGNRPGETSGDDARKLARLAKTALVGVPAAYVVSGSVVVTLIGAVVAVILVLSYTMRRSR